jgi:GWxTD domain-containing protein
VAWEYNAGAEKGDLMGRVLLSTIVVLLITAGPAFAQMSAEYADYFEGPEGWLLTKDEAKQWKEITDDAAAKSFIELFWAKRDHDLETPVNEFRQEFNMRVEAADTNFGFAKTRGAMSDRGRVIILLGRFSKRDSRAAAAAVGGNVNPGSAAATAVTGASTAPSGYYDEEGSTEIWEYDTSTLPVKLKQKVIYAIYKESKIGLNDYILDRALRENTYVQKLLLDIPEAMVMHPTLTEVPRFGLLPKSQPASAEQITWFDGEGPWPEDAKVVSAEGLVAGPQHFAWVSLFLPAAVATGDTMVGRLRSVDSESDVGTFVIPVEPLASPNGSRYELALPIESGAWAVDLAVAGGAEPLAVTSFEVKTTPDRLEGTMISPIYWGAEVVKVPDATYGDPFNVGGWHLIAPERAEMTASDSIDYMWYVLNPVLDESGEASFEMVMSLYKDGKRVMRGSPRPVQLSKIADGIYMAGSGISLEIFKEPGDFKLRIQVEQTSDSLKREGEFHFTIAGPEDAETEG